MIRNTNKGFTILFAILFTGFLLAITLALTAVFVPKLKISGESTRSSAALYAAESGVEWCLYVNVINSTITKPIMDNGAVFTPDLSPLCLANPLRTIGNFRGVTRALEVAY